MRIPVLGRGSVRIIRGLFAASLVLFASGPLFAGLMAAADFDITASLPGIQSGYETGFYFRPLQDLSVTKLGFLDMTNSPPGSYYTSLVADGLLGTHEVALFEIDPYSAYWDGPVAVQPTYSQLASAVIQAGELSPLEGWFRYESIAPVTLQAGHTYAISALSTADVPDWSIDFFDYSSFDIANGSPEGVAFSSLIEYRGGSNNTVYSSGDPIGLPTTFYAPNPTYDISDYTSYQGVVEFGPNFQFELAAPATVPEPSSALLLGLGAATLIRRRRFRRRSSDRNDS